MEKNLKKLYNIHTRVCVCVCVCVCMHNFVVYLECNIVINNTSLF